MSADDAPEMRRRGPALRLAPIIIGVVVIGGLLIRGCQEGPFGRQQLVALGPTEEARLGAQAFHEVLKEADVVAPGPLTVAVQRVANQLIRATANEGFLKATKIKPQDFTWDLRVVRSREVNAFCLPGGKIVVYTGILPVAETEVGLSVVMGHEIAHALAHHGAERMAQQQVMQIGQAAAAQSLGDMDPRARAMVLGAINVGAKFGVMLPYSRNHESEADRLGLYLMALAGYDPREAPRFWQRMASVAGGKSPPEFMSTHPGHETRVADLTQWQAEVEPFFSAARPAIDANRRLPFGLP